MIYTITQFRDNKIVYYGGQTSIWTNISSVAEAIELIETLKVTGRDSVFSIENSDGTVVEVIKTPV